MTTDDPGPSGAASPTLPIAPRLSRRARVAVALALALLALTLLTAAVATTSLGFALNPVASAPPPGGAEPWAALTASPSTADLTPLLDDANKLTREIARAAPRGTYLVVDRANNRLWVRDRRGVVHEAVVSTGSGAILKESGGQQRTWTFDTPAGHFRVLNERSDPVWVKPDWAFLEEGQQPPSLYRDRVDRASLGEWALDLGDGYMIHGTLYERLLGRSLTHGCIRVGRDDLRIVARVAGPGTPVFIF